MTRPTSETVQTVQTDIARIAKEHPNAVMLAALEVLIEIAAGDNPALRDYKKLQIYRGIRHTLDKRGFR